MTCHVNNFEAIGTVTHRDQANCDIVIHTQTVKMSSVLT
jgi:hypothetical protein